VHWLKGRLSVGLGQRDEAAKVFFFVREGFLSRGITYDATLVSMELSAVLKGGNQRR
jgi:hypothetical protein